HPVVAECIEVAEPRGFAVPATFIEAPRAVVVLTRRRFHHEQSRLAVAQAALDFLEQARTAARALMLGMHGDPVEVVGPVRPRRRAVADVAGEIALAGERADELVAGDAGARIERHACRTRS